AGIDDVVAGVREAPGLVRNELVTLDARVTRAVLFGVAENHERRDRAATAVDGDGVVAAAAVHDGQRTTNTVDRVMHRRLDRERIVAAAQQDLERLDVLVGDAAGNLADADWHAFDVEVVGR